MITSKYRNVYTTFQERDIWPIYKIPLRFHTWDMFGYGLMVMGFSGGVSWPVYVSTLPLKLMRGGTTHHFGNNIFMSILGQPFSKHIGQLIMWRNIGQTKFVRDIMLTNEVAVNFYVLSALMEDGILCNANGTCVILIKWSKTFEKNTKLMKETTKPNNLTTSRGHRPVFSFSSWSGKSALFLTLPGDEQRS